MSTPEDPTALVAAGYDLIADTYRAWSDDPALRLAQLATLTERLPPAAHILELGCGDGVPVSRALVGLGHAVTGIDVSPVQVERARINVPGGDFHAADMTKLDLPPAGFNAAIALYAITHVPRAGHAALFARIASWLKPGGLLIASLGARDCPDWKGEWLGTPMFFSHFDAATNRKLLMEAGFDLLSADVVSETENGEPVEFLWVLAQRA